MGPFTRKFAPAAAAAIGMLLFSGCTANKKVAEAGPPPVIVSEDNATFLLDNGTVRSQVAKTSGDLVSLKFKGTELLAATNGSDGWSHDAAGSESTEARVTVHPSTNGGTRGEVSVKGSNPRRASDVEIRYSLGQGESGIYTYSIFQHQPTQPAGTFGEAKFTAKLDESFDFLSSGLKWNKPLPKQPTETQANKFNLTAVQSENPAYGWSSTTKKVGFWIVNPTNEYLSGGPTKVEFLGHRDAGAPPTVLNVWRSTQYGGTLAEVSAGESWSKVVGPFLIYVNSGAEPLALYVDAQAQQKKENAKWPYNWVTDASYPQQVERATVNGQLVLIDSETPKSQFSKLKVGLSAPSYRTPSTRPAQARQIDWQTDAKNYQFWVNGDEQGRFSIPDVRPGQYTLHAFADGILGEYAKADVQVAPGAKVDLGKLTWTPVRRGRALWEIGIPNRSGSEFLKGNDYANDGMPHLYAKLFPNDVNFVIGKSDYRTDWYFQHVPHSENPDGAVNTVTGGGGFGRATPFGITFFVPSALSRGKATLRIGIAGVQTRAIDVTLNGQPIGQATGFFSDSSISRNGIAGIWTEREVSFDATLLRPGSNVLKLIVPAGPVTAGVIYDYLRLELDEMGAQMAGAR